MFKSIAFSNKAAHLFWLISGIILCQLLTFHPANGQITLHSDTGRIRNDLVRITKTDRPRNYQNLNALNYVADYIFNELRQGCDTVYFQEYQVNGSTYKNVIGKKGKNKPGKIIIGAHYDAAGNQEGADDNASGVSGLLELSRLISNEDLKYQIEFVAYTLEEPPFFRTDNMGSHIHARSLSDKQEQITGMICLEMIGYFSDEKNSQDYPISALKLLYGTKGNFITVVQKTENGAFGPTFSRIMKKQKRIRTISFKGSDVAGIDFSDHLNYWRYNYPAVMITNTAFFRNKNYHKSTDKLETLDLYRMALVIDEVFLAIKVFNL